MNASLGGATTTATATGTTGTIHLSVARSLLSVVSLLLSLSLLPRLLIN